VHLIFSLLLFVTSLFSYYAKVEPYRVYNVKADISGKVVEVNRSCEARSCSGVVIKVDDYQNRVDLHNLEIQLKNLKTILASQKEIVARKKESYKIFKQLKTKSTEDKNLKFYDYQNSLIAMKQSENSIANLEAQIKKLKDIISKKSIRLNGYIYKLGVEEGDYLNPSSLLAVVMDIKRVKLTIYVPIKKIESIKGKKIYINGKESNFVIDKIYKVADEKFITSYKVELVGNYPTLSDIVKVEFK